MEISADAFNKITLAVVALVAAVVGPLLQWYIAHRQADLQSKISDRSIAQSHAAKRQAWIDGLRVEIAEMVVQYSILITNYSDENFAEAEPEAQKAMTEVAETARARAYEKYLCIEMRLNPADTLHARLETAMKTVKETANLGGSVPDEKLADLWQAARESLLVAAKAVLDAEWRRANGMLA